MEEYFINNIPQSDGNYEVHKKSCFYLPLEPNRTSLGFFNNCYDAVKKAKETYPSADGCAFCSNECNN